MIHDGGNGGAIFSTPVGSLSMLGAVTGGLDQT